MIQKLKHNGIDTIMYAMMNYIQWKLRKKVTTQELLESYLQASSMLDRTQFFEVGPMEAMSLSQDIIKWKSPTCSTHPENNYAQSLFFPSIKKSGTSKTLIMLHGLMSIKNEGYRKIAASLNQKGWNVLFPYLPFHYSRSPAGHASGALAITADLVHNGETLRQSVQEIRQLVRWSREQGSEKVAILGTSYGAWVAALLLSVEPVEAAFLLQPIVDISYTTFQSPISLVIRQLLERRGITRAYLDRHAHLTSPIQGQPLCPPSSISIIGATYDAVSPPRYLRQLCETWKGSSYYEVQQGHFGFLVMQQALELVSLTK